MSLELYTVCVDEGKKCNNSLYQLLFFGLIKGLLLDGRFSRDNNDTVWGSTTISNVLFVVVVGEKNSTTSFVIHSIVVL